ncbi:MAG: ferrochelatase [Rhodospirillaceae bacterium]|jgi:protoporphyrin/coproporphyrin ferrochelatase|nr:ferrochelatase [Rhodospirillaceae bacterium]MBT5458181.1 ferrochelatase [Rhodospirillaceae bacterium]
MARIAVVLFNLGGPDGPEAVQPFLFNLFNDPFIMRQPNPIRWLLAKLISSRRAPVAREIYAQIGGRSPIFEETQKQADALAAALAAAPEDDDEFRVFIAMRYWKPFAEECAAEVKSYDPDRIVLMPLYPQFSTTTTQSFLSVWGSVAQKTGLEKPTASLCCYPEEIGFTGAVAALTRTQIDAAGDVASLRILFSAHGLPKKFVAAGDPYQAQVEMTVAAILEKLAMPDLDHIICYQSRVGPIEWLRPYTDDEIRRAGREGKSVIVVPVAFVSEHSETLVELDLEYEKLARESGVTSYHRVPTVGTHPEFIEGLARLVHLAQFTGIGSSIGDRQCPGECGACPIESGLKSGGGAA